MPQSMLFRKYFGSSFDLVPQKLFREQWKTVSFAVREWELITHLAPSHNACSGLEAVSDGHIDYPSQTVLFRWINARKLLHKSEFIHFVLRSYTEYLLNDGRFTSLIYPTSRTFVCFKCLMIFASSLFLLYMRLYYSGSHYIYMFSYELPIDILVIFMSKVIKYHFLPPFCYH